MIAAARPEETSLSILPTSAVTMDSIHRGSDTSVRV